MVALRAAVDDRWRRPVPNSSMATVSVDEPRLIGAGTQPAVPPQLKASVKDCDPLACVVTTMAAATPSPLALAVYRPGATVWTSTVPLVWTPSPLVTVTVAWPLFALLGARHFAWSD